MLWPRKALSNQTGLTERILKVILFDIDGTLINAADAPKRAFNTAFKETFGVEPVMKGVNTHGATDPEINRNVALATFDRDIKPEAQTRLNNRYIELLHLEIEEEPNYQVLPGVKSLLYSLAKRSDVLIGLQTGNLKDAGEAKLGRGNLSRFFSFGAFGTDSDERSQIVTIAIQRAQSLLKNKKMTPGKVTIVGDAPQDVRAGKAVGAQTIAVLTGIYSEDALALECPSYILPDLSDKSAFYKTVGLF